MASHTRLEVLVTEAPAAQQPVFERLLQLYLHDFSEYATLGSKHGEVDENGLFAYPRRIDEYWQEPGRIPLLIRVDGRIAGFILLNQWSALDGPLDRAVAEFFVLRKYRRARIGTHAARHVFQSYPGRWEVPVADYNQEALSFWRVATSSLHPAQVMEHAGDDRRWSGTVLCFDTGPAA